MQRLSLTLCLVLIPEDAAHGTKGHRSLAHSVVHLNRCARVRQSVRVLLHSVLKVWCGCLGILSHSHEGIVIHKVIGFSEVSEADVNWLVEFPCFLHQDPQGEQLNHTTSALTETTLVLMEEEFCTRLELI